MPETDKIDIVFMGTPEFAVPCLQAVAASGHRVIAAVTQPDRPKGRKRVMTPPPVKEEAIKLCIPVLQPHRLREPSAVEELVRLKPDLIVTAAYGQILPKAVLELPRFGCINVHGSLLPKYRGGAPIQRAIINGETVTGVTIMYMAEGLDTGDMIRSVEVGIDPYDDNGALYDKLSAAGSKLLAELLPELLAGSVAAVPQNDGEATYAPNLSREDERIDWSRPAIDIYNQIRGLSPAPGAFTLWNGEVMKAWKSERPDAAGSQPHADAGRAPGTVLALNGRGIEVMTGRGTLWLTQIQPAGRKAMEAGEFARGGQMRPGDELGAQSE